MTPQRIQPIRVLFIDHVPRLSGAEQSLSDLVAELGTGPVEPVVVLPNDGPLAARLRAHGVLVRMVPMSKRMLETSRRTLARRPFLVLARLLAFLVAGWRLYRLIREVRPRIVHTNTLKSNLIAVLPCKLARVPLVWHVRDILPDSWLRRTFVACGRFASVIIVPSRAVAEAFRGNKRVYRRLRLIPNGIRVRDFQDAKDDRSLREMMGVGASDPVVGIVGRIAPWKGQDVFLRAAAMVAQRHPRAHFAIAGAVLFPENDAAFERELHRMVLALGIEDRITFLGWQPAPETMAALDVLVHASREPEPFGRTIVEAMAAGKPVVAAAEGAVPEILPPSAGFLVPPSRPELLADALDRLLADRKLRKRMGEAGAAVADTFFPVERTVQLVGQLYRSLAVTSARRAAARRRFLPKRLRTLRRRRVAAEQPFAWPRPQVPPPSPAPAPHRPVPSRRVSLLPPEPPAARAPALLGPSMAARAVAAPAPVAVQTKPLPVSGAQEAVLAIPAFAPPIPLPRFRPRTDVFRPRPLYDLAKRVMDVVLATAILILGLPIWICVAVAIKLESPGPVLYRGIVYGKSCEPFTYYKFRSMRSDGCDAEHRKFIERYVRHNGGHEMNGQTVYKLMDDARVTAVGRFIRRMSIDEIPQLINVLRGEMSIVGPRPPLDYEYELYDERMKSRMAVLPGITGLQQVEARHDASFEDKLRIDTEYVRHRSILLDLTILIRTIPAALRGH